MTHPGLLSLALGALASSLVGAQHEGWTPIEVPSAKGWEVQADGKFADHDGFAQLSRPETP